MRNFEKNKQTKTRLDPEQLQEVQHKKGKRNRTVRGGRTEWQAYDVDQLAGRRGWATL